MKSHNETEIEKPIHGRWYDDACGTAFGLEVVGERWALLVVRELMFGPLRFSDLRAALPGLSAKILTERLAGLERSGVLRRLSIVDPVPARLYGLTEWGYAAEPIIQELGRWAAASPLHDPTLPLSPASFMLSLRTMLNRSAARDHAAEVAFAIGTARFTARLTDGQLPVTRGDPEAPDLRFTADSAPPLAAIFYGNVDPETVGVQVAGDPELFASFVGLFELPTPLASP